MFAARHTPVDEGDDVLFQPRLEVLVSGVGTQKYGERVRRLKAKIQAHIWRDAWLDESYMSRLFSGERTNPSRDALVLLGNWGLELAVEEVDELLMAADYKPLVLPASIR